MIQVLSPCTQMGGPDGVPHSWFQPGLVLAVVGIWVVNQHLKVEKRSVFLCVCSSAFQIFYKAKEPVNSTYCT